MLGIEALGYNPAIQWYRRRTPEIRTEWERGHILTIGDLRKAKRYLNLLDVEFFHLFSILGVTFRNTSFIGDHNIGFSYKSSDIDTFLKLILKLSSDEKLRLHQSQDAASLFHNKFSSKIIYEAYANHVESVASQKGKR
jgi:hypothetical protein